MSEDIIVCIKTKLENGIKVEIYRYYTRDDVKSGQHYESSVHFYPHEPEVLQSLYVVPR